MEQLQISKPLRSGAQAQQQQETLWMQQQEMLQMQIQQEIQQELQEMLQMQIQQEMRQRQLQQLDDPDHVDELTDQECIDNIMKTLSSHGL